MISIIVPVYNADKYLNNCIQSILNQTYTELELLLIDDGSTDQSRSICDDYAQKDSRIRVFHKNNGGVCSARNLGLDNAKGDWIGWVDSDDYVDVRMYELLYEAAHNKNADIVYCDYYGQVKSIMPPDTINKTDFIRNYLLYVPVNSLWATLAKREIYVKNNIRFNENNNMGEDLLITSKLYYYADKRAYVAKELYYYMTNENSICHSANVSNLMYSMLNNLSELNSFFQSTMIYEDIKSAIAVRILAAKRYFLLKDSMEWYSIQPWTHDYIFYNHFNTIKGKCLEWVISCWCRLRIWIKNR